MATSPGPFIIEEDISPSGKRVELREWDLPHGFPREQAIFESGGSIDIANEGIYNPGSERPVYQVMQARERDLVVHGHLRDRYTGTAGHARNMRNALDVIRRRGNPVKVTWTGEERVGVLKETKFGEEGEADITYELTFKVGVAPPGKDSKTDNNTTGKPDSASSDVANNATLIALTFTQQLLAISALPSPSLALAQQCASVNSSLNALGAVATTLDAGGFSTPKAATQAAQRVNAAASAAAGALATLAATLNGMTADTTLTTLSQDSRVTWWKAQFGALSDINTISDGVRGIRMLATAQLRQTTQLYRVQPGDTLESVAQQFLGSRSRVNDMGISADQLVPGTTVRIPQAV